MELFTVNGKHLHLTLLKHQLQRNYQDHGYIYEDVPTYPRPELHVCHVSHSTDLLGLQGIGKDGGFRDPKYYSGGDKLVWFSLTVSADELRDADTRDMKIVAPGEPERWFRAPAGPATRAPVDPTEQLLEQQAPADPANRPQEVSADKRRALSALENLSDFYPKKRRVHTGPEQLLKGPTAEEGGAAAEEGGTAADEGGTAAEEGGTAAEEGGTTAEEGRTTAEERGIIWNFASSPAFKSSSRYGSFRFTFSLRDVLLKYSQQFCGGRRPVLRVYETVLYKQEVMYVVLVHSPHNNRRFSAYPRLADMSNSICAFRAEPEPHLVWRPQAMSNVHRFELVEDGQQLRAEEVSRTFYVWDHVTLALHVDKVLQFEDHELRDNLRFCERDPRPVKNDTLYQTFKQSEAEVKELWPHLEHLPKFNESRFHILD